MNSGTLNFGGGQSSGVLPKQELPPNVPVDPAETVGFVGAPIRCLLTWEEGEILNGNYELRGVLGQGAMGRVYEAFDRLLQRKVAIKVARPNSPRGALFSEAQAMAAVRHPGVVQVYAAGVHAGTEYVVMERVFGTTLAEHLAEHPRFTVSEVLELLLGVGSALTAVHDAGIAHRDLKPSNILLAPGGRVVLLDFGVFLPEYAVGKGARPAGTPAYMAPETLLSTATPGGGHLADLYAFGLLGYELLSGFVPHEGKSTAQLVLARTTEDAPRISQVRDDVPGPLSALLSDLLERDPAARPQSLETVLRQLRKQLRQLREPLPQRTSVLLVSEDPALRRSLKDTLQLLAAGTPVLAVASLEAAEERVREDSELLLVLDRRHTNETLVPLCHTMRDREFCARGRVFALGDAPLRDDYENLGHCVRTQYFPNEPALLRALERVLNPSRQGRTSSLPPPHALLPSTCLVRSKS